MLLCGCPPQLSVIAETATSTVLFPVSVFDVSNVLNVLYVPPEPSL